MSCSENLHHAIERILEDESLTANLTDAAAKFLLDWGVTQAEEMMLPKEGLVQDFDTHLATLRRTMKRISRQAGEAAPEAQAEQVRASLMKIEMEKNLEGEIET